MTTLYAMNLSASTIYGNSKESIVSTLSNMSSNSKIAGCFGVYFSDCVNPDKFYFGFYALPTWIDKVVEELNIFFDGKIKFNLLHTAPSYLYEIDRYRNSMYVSTGFLPLYYNSELIQKDTHKLKYQFCSGVFNIEFSKDYSEHSKFLLGYVLHHILRQFSLTEKYISIEDAQEECPKDIFGFLENTVNKANKVSSYRTLYSERFSRDILKALTDINAVNFATTYLKKVRCNPRQTDILKFISFIKNNYEKIISIKNEDSPQETIKPYFQRGQLVIYKKRNSRIFNYSTQVVGIVCNSSMLKGYKERDSLTNFLYNNYSPYDKGYFWAAILQTEYINKRDAEEVEVLWIIDNVNSYTMMTNSSAIKLCVGEEKKRALKLLELNYTNYAKQEFNLTSRG